MTSIYDRNALFSVEGLVAVITGGGSGLGSNMALALDANGADVVYILGRRQESLDNTARKAINGSIKCIVCDVTSKDSLAAAASKIRKEVGFINVLLANSGVIGPYHGALFANGNTPSIQDLQDTLWSSSIDHFNSPWKVNVAGAFYASIAFLDLLDAGNKHGNVYQKSQVIVTSSIAAYSRSPAAGFAYSASKAAAVAMVKQFATCFAPYKIRANTIAPGLYPSEATQNLPFMQGADPRVEGNLPKSLVPLERTGTEQDIGGVALFLMSRAGAYVNGSVQITDGGRTGIQPSSY